MQSRTDTGAVTHQLVYHDLVSVPFGGREPGIYWLRMFVAGVDHVAVVTEVPGNPSFSVTNGTSQIISYVMERFGTPSHQLALFEIWPRGSEGWGIPNVKRVRLEPTLQWTESSRAEIESLVGASLPELPAHEELYRRVLAMGGGVTEERSRPVFEAVTVSDLPPPHNPWRCEHVDRFRLIAEQTQADSRLQANLEAGRTFLGTLTPADRRACRFHKGRWKVIADESVRIINQLGHRDLADYAAEATRSHLGKTDRDWLVSLFSHPIFIGGGAYTDGQHRGCALRFSGAEQAAVATDDESLGDTCVDWTYRGDG